MVRSRWARAVALDLQQVHDLLMKNHRHLARSTIAKLYDTTHSLKEMRIGDRPAEEKARVNWCFLQPLHIAADRVGGEAIEVLYIQHTSRRQS